VPAAAIDSSVESRFTPIAPCRIVDTRAKGGPISTSGRSFQVSGGSGFSAQGGTSSGCGIPAAATAVAVNMTTLSESAGGYLKAYPAGSSAPNASVLSYQKGIALSNAPTLAVRAGSATGLTVTATKSTQLIMDVTGYYIKPIWAHIAGADGAILAGSRAEDYYRSGPGTYRVFFDRDVASCSYQVTSYDLNRYGIAEPYNDNEDGVYVQMYTDTGTSADAEFYITVTC
jgi:hypothetical protein